MKAFFKRLGLFPLVAVVLMLVPDHGVCATNQQVEAGESSAAVVVTSTNGASVVLTAVVEHDKRIWLTFGLDRVPWLRTRPFDGIPLWQYLASIIFIVLAFYSSKLLDYVISDRLQRWAAKTPTRIDDIIMRLLRGPIRVVAFVVLLHIAMELYSWPDGFTKYFSPLLSIIVAAAITYVLLKAVDGTVGIWRERTTTPENEQFSRQLLPLIGTTIKSFLVIIVIIVTTQNLGLNVTGLIASLSIGGLALGLAAQDTLANLFGAVAVLVDKPFKVGDRVQLNGVDGSVEAIGFRSTRIRNLDGHLVTVPNKTMGNSVITNVTLRPNLKTIMNFGLTYTTPPHKVERAVAIIREVFQGPLTHDVFVTFDKFTDSTLNIQVIYWWKGMHYPDFLKKLQESNLEIMRRFAQENIQFAFPTRTLYLKQDGGDLIR